MIFHAVRSEPVEPFDNAGATAEHFPQLRLRGGEEGAENVKAAQRYAAALACRPEELLEV